MHKYLKGTYYLLIEDLRERRRVSRHDILSAYTGDPFLKRVHVVVMELFYINSCQ